MNGGTVGQTLISTVNGITARRESDCDNSGSAATYIGRLANIQVGITGPGCLHPGDLATLTISYRNNGNTAAVNVVVSDVLPPGLTFDSAVPAPSSVAGQNVTWNNVGAIPGTLAAGETGVIVVRARLANDCALIGQRLLNVTRIKTSNEQVSLADDRAQVVLDCITADVVSIGGYVYHERSGNCVREPGEGGIAGVTITLTGTVPCGSPVILTTVTDGTGQYNFTGLNRGIYTVTETQPTTWISTGDALGTINGTGRGSNLQPLDDVLGPIMINGGESALEYNFCENKLPPVLVGVPGNTNYQCLGNVPPPPTVTATDSCDGNTLVTLTIATNGTCPTILTYTWVASDRCGNRTTATRTVTVLDTIPPVLVGVPGNTNFQCLGDVPSFSVTATDNCDDNIPVALTIATNGSCPTILTYTWVARDRCTNSASATRTVTVLDTIPPVLVGLPGNTNFQCLGDVPSFSVTATDNCDDNIPVTLTVTTNGSCPTILTYTWVARDRCTNSTTAVRSVSVLDTIPPVITCASNKTVQCGTLWAFDPPTATDNCGTASIRMIGTATNSQPGNRFTVTRCWTATDSCSNSVTCCQTVTVITVHDGDQNKVGGDVGQGCLTVCFQQGNAVMVASPVMTFVSSADAQPRLSFQQLDGGFILQWPAATAPGFILETTTNLAAPASWSEVPNAASPFTVTNPPVYGARFYRLRKP